MLQDADDTWFGLVSVGTRLICTFSQFKLRAKGVWKVLIWFCFSLASSTSLALGTVPVALRATPVPPPKVTAVRGRGVCLYVCIVVLLPPSALRPCSLGAVSLYACPSLHHGIKGDFNPECKDRDSHSKSFRKNHNPYTSLSHLGPQSLRAFLSRAVLALWALPSCI